MNMANLSAADLDAARDDLFEMLLRGKSKPEPEPGLPPRSISQNHPASFGQERMWFLSSMADTGAAYHTAMGLDLRGKLVLTALHQSFQILLDRHEPLRTTFFHNGQNLVQRIRTDGVLDLPLMDISFLPEQARELRLKAEMRREFHRPFDLARDLMMRCHLFRFSETRHVLALTFHHISVDAWSLNLLFEELQQIYNAWSTGRIPRLAVQLRQYADYACWQRGQYHEETLAGQLAHWRRRLEAVPTLELPTDFIRPAKQSFVGHLCHFQLPSSQLEALDRLGQEHHASRFMVLATVLQVLLARYSGQNRFCIGSPVANRRKHQSEGLVGFFVNTMPIPVSLNPEQNFRQLLEQMRDEVLQSFALQETPFERLVDALQPNRDFSRNPLVQVAIAYQEKPPTEGHFSMGDLEVGILAAEHATVRFDLELHLWPQQGGLGGTLIGATSLFENQSLEQMAAQFQFLLNSITRAPESRVSGLALEPVACQLELQNLGRGLSPSETRIFALPFDKMDPHAPAVVTEQESLSWGQLQQRSAWIGGALQAMGVGPEDVVVLCMERSPQLILAMVALLGCGGNMVLVNPEDPPQRLATILAESRAKLMICQNPGQHHSCPAISLAQLEDRGRALMHFKAEGQMAVYSVFTSGSTGTPRCVVIPHEALANLTSWHRRVFELQSNDRVAWTAGLAFDATHWEVWSALSAGASIHIPTEETRLLPESMRDWMVSQAISLSFVATPLAEQMLCLEWPPVGSPRLLLTGGDRLHPLALSVPFRLINNYGPSENTVVATSTEAVFSHNQMPPIGRPIDGVEVLLLDAWGQQVARGISGELCIGGVGLSRGYLGSAAHTASRFTPNPYGQPGSRLYHSGDLARWNNQGQLMFLGRLDRQLEIRGLRVEPGEIEAVLTSLEGISEAAVCRIGSHLVAFLRSDLAQSSDLRSLLKDRLPRAMIPDYFQFLARIPLTANGKVDFARLEQQWQQPEAGVQGPPQNATQQLLAGLWQEVLKLERVGINQNFFDLGGHSMALARIHVRLKQNYPDLSIARLFEFSTIRDLAAHLDQSTKPEVNGFTPAQRADARRQARASSQRIRERKS